MAQQSAPGDARTSAPAGARNLLESIWWLQTQLEETRVRVEDLQARLRAL